ncbi:MAG: hypothetical protein HXY40_18835 [Chloroflexi bacterium]|nr:hypothetical protein [Chloroflexota bacterium]
MTGRLKHLLIEELAKHLPPSAASLRLLDVAGAAGAALAEVRADLDVITVEADSAGWQIAPNSVDAVVVYGAALDHAGLNAAQRALRPGGRLIMVDPAGEVNETHVKTLEDAGYTRILVGVGVECPLPAGVLMRGEKPHATPDTLERIQGVAGKDDAVARQLSDLQAYSGRYVHLLVQQTPNKPVWALQPHEKVDWQAVALEGAETPVLLAFSSLARAVAFMQPAVLAGKIRDINKVARFRKEVAQAWPQGVLLNPEPAVLQKQRLTLLAIDPASAEAPGE